MVELTGAIPDGWRDPAGGLRDIAARRFRYARSPLFRQSQLHRAGRDIEAFSALLYLQPLAEASIPADAQAAQPGWVEVSAVFADGLSDVSLVPMLQQHAYLRGNAGQQLDQARRREPMSNRGSTRIAQQDLYEQVWSTPMRKLAIE